jgi:hypothetical protein
VLVPVLHHILAQHSLSLVALAAPTHQPVVAIAMHIEISKLVAVVSAYDVREQRHSRRHACK